MAYYKRGNKGFQEPTCPNGFDTSLWNIFLPMVDGYDTAMGFSVSSPEIKLDDIQLINAFHNSAINPKNPFVKYNFNSIKIAEPMVSLDLYDPTQDMIRLKADGNSYVFETTNGGRQTVLWNKTFLVKSSSFLEKFLQEHQRQQNIPPSAVSSGASYTSSGVSNKPGFETYEGFSDDDWKDAFNF